MSINSSSNIRTSNIITNISISSKCRVEIRCRRTSRVTTLMHPHTSSSNINNTQQSQTRNNQCRRIQLFRRITWMRWVMVCHLLRAIRHICSQSRTPAQWSCITPLWETKAPMQRRIRQRHSTARMIPTSFYPKATRCSSTLRHSTRYLPTYTRSIHRLEHL